jgi:uncharacterized protein (TIGR02145 family)
MKKKYALALLILFWSCMFWSKAQTVIKMEKSGGVYKIPCKVNGLDLKFIFGSRASDLSISLTEVLFMLENEYLSENDIMDTDYRQNANGDIKEGTKVNIKCIEVGGLKIYNVQASITHTDKAPLLFGQAALRRFGKFSIDYLTDTLFLGSIKNNGNGITQPQAAVDQASQKVCQDIDSNTYKTVKIGSQIWMAENLKTSHYRDGSDITEIEDYTAWADISNTNSQTPAWCYYGGNPISNTYGKLYNWYAVTDSRQLCPTGWHVPSDAEFTLLIDYLGGDQVAGGHMKAQTLWYVPNTGAGNSSGFTALPAGYRYADGTFYNLGYYANFWSSTEYGSGTVWNRSLDYNNSSIKRNHFLKKNGLSVRCVGD